MKNWRGIWQISSNISLIWTHVRKSLGDRGVKLCAVLTGPYQRIWQSNQANNSWWNLSATGLSSPKFIPGRKDRTILSATSRKWGRSPWILQNVSSFSLNSTDISLRQSQYPFAVEHYRLRFNKTKRRRPRIPPAQPNLPPPLDAKGWSVRTNYKLAAFSEYKQELDVAVKFYELAYNELIDLFSSTAILPPRSKRWTEARVLADSISYKVSFRWCRWCSCASYLYTSGIIYGWCRHSTFIINVCRFYWTDGVLGPKQRNTGIGYLVIIVFSPNC